MHPKSTPPTILGIDPGTTLIGFGVIQSEPNGFRCLDYGTIRHQGDDAGANLMHTASALASLILKHKPAIAAVERLFFTKNQKTAMAVGEMRGVIMLTFAQHGIPVREFTPLQVKRAIAGYGGADKKQVQRMAQMILRIKEPISPDDAADALALAMCCGASLRG